MTSSPPLTLRTAIGVDRHYAPLRDGTVTIPGVEIEHVPVPVQVDIFRRMARDVEFDVAEMSVVSYLCAKEYGIPFTAIPIVLRTLFHHRDFLYNVNAGIAEPKDLEGKRVGTRTYTVTPGVLDRGILSDEFGVDVDSITWVLAELEHVPQCQDRLPANTDPVHSGDLFPALDAGDIDAGIAGANLNRSESPNVKPLFPNAIELDRAYYQRTGIVQPFTLLVVKDTLLDAHPWLAEALFAGFKEARERNGFDVDAGVVEVVGDDDPLPYGLSANRAAFEEAIRLAHEQHIISERFAVDDLFPALD